jgi:hypothetical protein
MGKGCVFVALLATVVGLSIVYGGYLFLNPYDEVAVEVSDVPSDTKRICLVADVNNEPVVMLWSFKKVFPSTMHPRGCTVSVRVGDDKLPHNAAVRWVANRRVGVVLTSKSGVWRVAWFDQARSRIQERSFLFGGGKWRASLLDASEEQVLDESSLRKLGLD